MAFQSTFISVANKSIDENSSWIYLVDWILALILGLAFVFYFGRLVGFVISLALKLIVWKKYKARINIESLRISLLGGRIFARNLTIITSDQAISILQLNLTWRYWISKLTRLPEYYLNDNDIERIKISKEENERLPSRFTLLIEGLEIFMYNRTAAYDNMMNILREQDNVSNNEKEEGEGEKSDKEYLRQNIRGSNSNSSSSKENMSNGNSRISSASLREKLKDNTYKNTSSNKGFSLYFLLKLLPLHIRIKKGAVVLGNITTPSILVASFKMGNAIVDVSQAPCILDNYRFFYNFNFERFQVSMKPNIAYDKFKYSNPNTYSNFSPVTKRNTYLSSNNQKKYEQWYHFNQAVNSVSRLIKKPFKGNRKLDKAEDDSTYDQWKGLKRYLGDLAEGQDFLGTINTDEEYAKYSLILDSSYTRMTYYYDSPGFAPDFVDTEIPGPEFGVDMELSMATIHYGPWADKQRTPLQEMFFPTLSRDSKPTEGHNAPGKLRNYDGFNFLTTIKDQLIFRVPTREPSKHTENLRSQKVNTVNTQTNKVSRPFGWLELNMKEGSSFYSFNSYVATKENGWDNDMKAFFNSFEVRSSVNHDVLFLADTHSIDCKVGFPLEWNGKCDWVFDNISNNGKIFFLREHTMLVSDIFADFASGPPLPYESFKPFHYHVNWKFNTYKLYLNVNDNNIINNPLDFSSNKYLSFQGDDLRCEVSIPLFGQFSKSTTIDYEIHTSFTNFILDTPQWHTANAFMKSNLIGKSKDFTINGSYTYFNEVEINTSNYAVIKILGDYVTLKFYGFVVRYLFAIRENYIGENMHFKTFEEYSDELAKSSQTKEESSGSSSGDSESVESKTTQPNYWKMIKSVNDVDILFMFQVRHGLLLLPYNLYDCSSHVGLGFDSFDIDIRFTNYYSDLQADFSAISIAFVDGEGDEINTIFDIPRYTELFLGNNQDASIDGLTIHTHRMFGLPPKEVTYYSKWDFATEAIDIDSDGVFVLGIMTSLRSFSFGFKDMENGLDPNFPFIPNAANFLFRCPHVLIKLKPESDSEECSYLSIDLDSILLSFNDMANERYSERLSASIPLIIFKIVEDSTGGSKLLAFLETSLVMDNIMQKENSSEFKRLQQEHIRRNDAPYHRCPFILDEYDKDDVYTEAYGCIMTSLTLIDASYPLNKASHEEMESDEYSIFAPSFDTNNDSLSLSLTLILDGNSNFALNKMAPLSSYDTQDYFPAYDVDSNFKIDNLIFDVGEILSFFTPQSLIVIYRLARSFKDYTLTKLIDDLHVDVVQKLKLLIKAPSFVDNIRFVTQEINLKFGEFDVSDPLEVFGTSPKVPIINLNIIEPSLAFSNSTNREVEEQTMSKHSDAASALHLKEVFFSVSKPTEFTSPLNLSITDIEFWQKIYTNDNLVWSFDVENTNLEVDEPQLEWLLDYSISIIDRITPAILKFKRLSEANKKCVSELVYKISTAGRDFHIDHDPGVMTKPASVLRSQKDHIRFFDSWKVMTRLRHVFDNLPEQWLHSQNKLFKNFDWEAPDDAYDEVLRIFSQWRSWEVDDIQRSYFFNFIFSKRQATDVEIHRDTESRVHMNDVNITLMSSEKDTDFIDLHDLTATYSHKFEKLKDLSSMNLGIIESVQGSNILFHLESYKSKFSPLTLALYPLLKRKFSLTSKVQGNEDGGSKCASISRNLNIEFIYSVNEFQQSISFPYTTIEFRGSHIINMGHVLLLQEISDIIPFSFSIDAGTLNFVLWVKENKLASGELEDFDLLAANFGTLKNGVKIIDTSINKCNFNVLDENNSFCESLTLMLENDIEFCRETIFENHKQGNKDSTNNNNIAEDGWLFATIGSFSLEFQVNELCWFIDILYPLKLKGIVYNNHLSWHFADDISILESFVQKLTCGININNISIVEIENSQLLNNIKFSRVNEKLAISTSSSLEYSKFFVPKIIKTLEIVIANLEQLESKFKQLGLVFNKEKNDQSKKHTEGIEENFIGKIVFRSKFTNNYIGVSTFVDTSKVSLELENFSVGIYNFENINQNGIKIGSIVPLYGYLSIPTTRVSIIDRAIPIGLSNFLDVNLSIKVYNENEVPTEMLSLQVESQYCRICLSPQILFKLVNIVDKLTLTAMKISMISNKKVHNKTDLNNASESNVVNSIFLFSAIHVLCYNFCIGWLFGDPHNDYPGIILGAERFFAVVEENLGKFTLIDAYLSVANGLRSSNFYSPTSEKGNLNRASLPNMQIIYTIEGVDDSRNMRIIMNGDELDVKFLSDSIVILEYTVASVSRVQRFFNRRVKPNLPETNSTRMNESQGDYMQTFKSAFASIELIATFAGSNVLFYRLSDKNDLDGPPSLFLHSPAVKIATMYKHEKHSNKKHVIKSEVLTSSSDNTLYSSCMPVIMDIAQGIKKMMRKSNSENSHVAKKPTNESAKDFDFGELLGDIDIHIGVRIERQKLALSCEPTAKVATIVGIEGIYMQINTGPNGVPSLTAAVQFDSISASLQHIYSREVSGSVGLKQILLTSSVKMENVLSILSSGSFTDVEAYINVKQFQDVNLFKDIWFPKSKSESYFEPGNHREVAVRTHERSELASNRNISSRFKEVSTTYALPWFLTFMVFNVSLRMDFGQSLGDFILKSDRIWLVSKKSTDWAQDLKLGVNSITLSAEGRLSGMLTINSIFLHTAINWKNNSEETFDVPLILVSGGIDCLQLKLSFDYHVFAIASIQGYAIDIFNKKNQLSVSKDHLFVTTKFDNVELYITSLAASNVLDIYNAIIRMTQENKTSYKETLRDSSRGRGIGTSLDQKTTSNDILETVKKLETKIEVVMGKLLIHVYPSSFSDSKVLVITLDESIANFQQNEYSGGISNQLDIQFNDLNVSLSMASMILEDFTHRCNVNEFVEHAHKASGGTIFVFPSFKISMRTFQKYQSNVIEYLYQSSFGKSVDIRWNLGSIIFIREMYSIHKKALASRTQYKKRDSLESENRKIRFNEDIFTRNKSKASLGDEDPTDKIDQAINDTLNKVSKDSKFSYLPLAPPIIEAPQLKELGNATPPLEWFGLHRNKFPNATHQMGIVSLQKLIHEVELQYSKILGKA